MTTWVDVKPSLLRWAVDRSGLPLAEYAPAVTDWLSGKKTPTFSQLEKFARHAMVPFGYLFLEQPPDETLPLPDYRTRTGDGVRRPTPNLIETIFEMQRRQDWMRDYLLDEGQVEQGFVGSAKVGDQIAPLASRMRESIGLNIDWADSRDTWEDALRHLRQVVEDVGILIFVNGIVGNNTRRRLDPEEFQGFVLIDRIAPLIFVNGADYKGAQMFTIAHELAHVWVGQSALFDLTATTSSTTHVEEYCNAVAAEFLVPADRLDGAWSATLGSESQFLRLGKRFKVSPVVVARRAKDCKLISADEFFDFYRRYMQGIQGRQRDRPSGGNFWSTQNLRLGHRFGAAVVSAAESGRISYSDAFDLTRLYGDTFDKYVGQLRQG